MGSGTGDTCEDTFVFALLAKIDWRMVVLLADAIKHPQEKGPLVSENVLLLQQVPCSETDCKLLCPSANLLCQIAHHQRKSASLFLMHVTTVTLLLINTIDFPKIQSPESIQSQLECLHLPAVDTEIKSILCQYPCCG